MNQRGIVLGVTIAYHRHQTRNCLGLLLLITMNQPEIVWEFLLPIIVKQPEIVR